MILGKNISAVRIKKPFSKRIVGVKNLLEIIFSTYDIVKEDVLLKQTNSSIAIEEILLLGETAYKSVVSVNDSLELYIQLTSTINNSAIQKNLSSKGFNSFTLYDLIKKEFETVFLRQYSIIRKKLLEEKIFIGILYLSNVILYVDSVPFNEWNKSREESYKHLQLYKPTYI